MPDDLLKILELTEDEQWLFLIKNKVVDGAILQCKGGGELPVPAPESFDDLAFRLRDEVLSKVNGITADQACQKVYFNYIGEVPSGWTQKDIIEWFAFIAKPIHWIIAALIAKKG